MKKRVLMSFIIGALLFGGVALRMVHPVFFDFIVIIIMVMSGIEMSRAIGTKFAKPFAFLTTFFPVFAYAAYIGGSYIPYVGGMTAILLFDLLMLLIMAIVAKASKQRYTMENVWSTMFVLIYPMTLVSFMFALNRIGLYGSFLGETPYGGLPIALLFMVSCFSDVFAFLVGRWLKGPKLAPKISPKKTVSGAIGGLLGGLFGASVTLWLASFHFVGLVPLSSVLSHNIIYVLIIGILGSVFTQAGDLVASYIKRVVDIKDYGKLLQGHGGVMDRVDGQMFNAVFLFIFFSILLTIL